MIRLFLIRLLCSSSLFLVLLQESFALSVTEMIDLAIANNQQYMQSQATIRASEFAREVAGAPSLPQVSLSADHKYTDSSAVDNLYNSSRASVTIRQSLFNKKLASSELLADIELKRARMKNEQQVQLLLKELADLYFSFIVIKEQLELLSAKTGKLQSLLEAEEEKFNVNATSSVNLSQVRADYYQARSQEILQQSRFDSASDRLISLLGTRVIPPLPKSGDKLDIVMPAGDEQSWVELAMQNNYSIGYARLAMETIDEQIKGIKGDNYPKVSVFGSYVWDRNDTTGTEASKNQRIVGIELSWLIYGGGSTGSQIDQFSENYSAAQFGLDYQQKTVSDTIRHYWRTLLATQSAIEANGLSVQSAYQAYQASEVSFESGVLKYSDLLTRQNNYFDADINLRSTRYNFMRDYISLYFNAGLLSRNTFIDIVSIWLES